MSEDLLLLFWTFIFLTFFFLLLLLTLYKQENSGNQTREGKKMKMRKFLIEEHSNAHEVLPLGLRWDRSAVAPLVQLDSQLKLVQGASPRRLLAEGCEQVQHTQGLWLLGGSKGQGHHHRLGNL